ncbi:hypothetical protein [Micromonospora psammae]|uniref:hypothetical protein n=1 Tax=Micromonospora sp. CPCC 205556 TaxID=3122398 RepID=UPI002FF1D9C8
MRLSRIIMALTVGLAVVAAPTAAGAAQPQPAPGVPQPGPGTPQPPPDYVPGPAKLIAEPTTIFLGKSVLLTGTGFGPNETVRIVVTVAPLAASVPGQAPARRSDGSAVAMAAVAYAPQPAPREFTVQTDENGRFTVRYRPTVVGQLTFTATGLESGQVASATVTVLKKKRAPHDGGKLPVTGDDMGTPLKVGGGLVGAGMVLMLTTFAWRRRNRFNVN